MIAVTTKELFVYPLKSGQGRAVDSVATRGPGLLHDRLFCLELTQTGALLSAREHPELSRIACEIDGTRLHFIDTVRGEQIACAMDDFRAPGTVRVWRTDCVSLVGPNDVNDWFSARLQCAVRLHLRSADSTVSDFFDTAPIHLISQQSLRELNRLAPVALPAELFRPNIVIAGLAAQEERFLAAVSINGVQFEVLDLCDRCSMLDALLQYADRDAQYSPTTVLDSLAMQCTDGRLSFGVYLKAGTAGVIRRGDAVSITHRF